MGITSDNAADICKGMRLLEEHLSVRGFHLRCIVHRYDVLRSAETDSMLSRRQFLDVETRCGMHFSLYSLLGTFSDVTKTQSGQSYVSLSISVVTEGSEQAGRAVKFKDQYQISDMLRHDTVCGM
eukprot:IDg3830t1